MLVGKAKEAEESNQKHHIMSEALNMIAEGLLAVSTIATTSTLFTEPTNAEFLAEQSKDLLVRQLASTVGTPGFDYSNNGNGFLTRVATIGRGMQEVVP